jgi:hypothetical protein
VIKVWYKTLSQIWGDSNTLGFLVVLSDWIFFWMQSFVAFFNVQTTCQPCNEAQFGYKTIWATWGPTTKMDAIMCLKLWLENNAMTCLTFSNVSSCLNPMFSHRQLTSCNLEMIRRSKTTLKWEVVVFWLWWELMWGCSLPSMVASLMQTLLEHKWCYSW